VITWKTKKRMEGNMRMDLREDVKLGGGQNWLRSVT
jgi:hypothetical protein